MSEVRNQLIGIAKRIAAGYAKNPKTRAIALVGSVARDQCDVFSDLDVTVYYDVMPTDDEILSARDHVPNVDWKRYPGGEPDDFFDIYYVDGVECQVGHILIDRIEHDFNSVFNDYATDHELHVVIGGIYESLPLFGESVIKRWQDQAADYPTALTEAMVRKYIAFRPFWVLEKRLLTRDAPLLLHQMLMDEVKSILSVLSGLNHLYPQLHFKRLDAYVARMAIAPVNASQRLKDVLTTPPQNALQTLHSLIEDMFVLVKEHLPSVDVSAAQQKFEQ